MSPHGVLVPDIPLGIAAYRSGGVVGTGVGDRRDRSMEQPRRDDKTAAGDAA